MCKRRRRFWSDGEKRRIVVQALVPGASVSQVARRYDVNANLVFTWMRDPRFQTDEEPARFLPVEVVADTAPVVDRPPPEASRIVIELASGHRLTVSGGVILIVWFGWSGACRHDPGAIADPGVVGGEHDCESASKNDPPSRNCNTNLR